MLTRAVIGLSLAATLVAPLAAAAADFTPISDRMLSDPTYLPLKGEYYSETAYDYNEQTSNNFDASGANQSSTHRTVNSLHQTFGYGITDQFSVSISEAYSFSGHATQTSGSTVTTNGISGWQDPVIGLTYRLFDQKARPVSVDIVAHYAPDAFSSHASLDGGDASVAQGGSEADFGLAIGRETKTFTIRGSLTAFYYASSTNENAGPKISQTTTSDYWSPQIGIQTQTRFTDRLSANVNAAYTINGSANVSNGVANLARTQALGDAADVDVALNYHLIPNRLVGSISYTHVFRNHTTFTYPLTPDNNGYRSGSDDQVGVLLRYAFR